MTARVTKRPTHYWLMKSEPDVYSIDDLERQGKSPWEGVRNYQARNHMRDMRVGDLAFFYHSSTTPPGVVGVARICREAFVDETQFDPKSPYVDPKSARDKPRWECVEVEFVEKLREIVTLDTLKTDPACANMLVIKRGMRLSVQPVDKDDFAHILKLGRAKTKLR